MKTLLTLAACVGLAVSVGAAPPGDQGENQGKKKGGGGGNAPQQQTAVAPQTGGGGKKFKAGPGGGPHMGNVQRRGGNLNANVNAQNPNAVGNIQKGKKGKWQGPVTGQTETNVSGQTNVPAVQSDANAGLKTKLGKGKFKGQAQAGVTGGGGPGKKFQKKHFNLQTQNKQVVINKYKTVNYNTSYQDPYFIKIGRSSSRYSVFANYHPQWHDTWWWNWHHPHVTFIYGGWYYWDNYYWYPAWGYAPDSVYYYDGPIYASSPQEDPAQVVANVQAALQEQGFYQGEIDGVLGPQTRAALAEYQSAQGLEVTGAVDEPTLETLGMV